jgi:hypothetical protein
MPRLMVRCPTTSEVSFTGLVMDDRSFSNCDFVFDPTLQRCAFCGELHSYSNADFFLDDLCLTDDKNLAAE